MLGLPLTSLLQLLTVKEVAATLGLSVHTIRNEIKTGRMKAYMARRAGSSARMFKVPVWAVMSWQMDRAEATLAQIQERTLQNMAPPTTPNP